MNDKRIIGVIHTLTFLRIILNPVFENMDNNTTNTIVTLSLLTISILQIVHTIKHMDDKEVTKYVKTRTR